jgi:hypothetical protein
LDKEGEKQVLKFLFINVPEVEVKIGHRRLASFAQGHDIIYNRGTDLIISVSQMGNETENGEPDHTFPGARYRTQEMFKGRRMMNMRVTHVFHVSTKGSHWISIH